jgi:hypothetical protein
MSRHVGAAPKARRRARGRVRPGPRFDVSAWSAVDARVNASTGASTSAGSQAQPLPHLSHSLIPSTGRFRVHPASPRLPESVPTWDEPLILLGKYPLHPLSMGQPLFRRVPSMAAEAWSRWTAAPRFIGCSAIVNPTETGKPAGHPRASAKAEHVPIYPPTEMRSIATHESH